MQRIDDMQVSASRRRYLAVAQTLPQEELDAAARLIDDVTALPTFVDRRKQR
jgi:hypothetical protein